MAYSINKKISSPNISSRDGKVPQIIVFHIAEGYYLGTQSWFLNKTSQTSSHFIVSQTGEICQCVDIEKMAWCNGTNSNPLSTKYFGKATSTLVKQLKGNANKYSVSIEFEGFFNKTGGRLTDKQFEAAIWLVNYIRDYVKSKYNFTIPFDRTHMVGHYEINPKLKPNCPGKLFQWDSLIKKLNPVVVKPVVPTITVPFPGSQYFGEGKINDYILMLDKALIAKGYSKYYASGISGASRTWGSGTQKACQAFQLAQGWTGSNADGIPGKETWKRLGLG